ncbi:acetoacetate-CoA ligase [Pluteus cervinus]|uniref:Acetoacetate-CoA ligase n=1 Tax=Pluteus cervinus TaxID=181527 RepID=A0ACD3AY46_9AGAR|nr:acetoacetate-CoA ligase [Pluteus cervinus]
MASSDTNPFSQSRLLWKHVQPQLASSELLRRLINRKRGLQLGDYHDLHKYSVENYDFWLDLWEFLRIVSSVPPTKAVDNPYNPKTWFPDARLNYAENLLYKNDDSIVLTAGGEDGKVTHYSARELRERVRKMVNALRVAGLEKGDRVAGIVTNSINAVAVALAVASIGGIFSSTATDMGVQGILDRYRQIQPKFIFTETEVTYSGKLVSLHEKVTAVVNDLASYGLKQAILFPSRVTGREVDSYKSSSITTSLSKFLQLDNGAPLNFEQLPFNQPLFILYSSGTSGQPKCIVHSAGGVLLQTKKDLMTMFSATPGDTYFQYTTTGWMMWVFMLAGLACGTRVILYDGSPFYPSLETYLKFINDQDVSLLGTSPRFLGEIQGRGIDPLKLAPFEALRAINSTGAVLTTPLFEWAQTAFGKDVHLISSSGGTDICAAFVTATAALPTYAGEIQCKSIGMKVEVYDPHGQNIEHTGQAGELVCTRPHPSLPLFFWGDKNGEKLKEAYYNMYPGVWRQGDFIVVNPKTKGMMILGRSDGVLNPSGVRFGSGEIYSILEKQFSTLLDDSLCIGQRRKHDLDEKVLLFVKMREGLELTEELEGKIKEKIKIGLSARHVPKYVIEVEDIPYTVNGKKIEIAVKQIVSGIDIQPSGTVANPESLKLYYKYRDIEGLMKNRGWGKVKAQL